MEVLIVLLLIALFIVGLVNIAGAVSAYDSSSKETVRRSSTEIEQITSEGKQAMDDLSEQYLNKVYNQVTDDRRR